MNCVACVMHLVQCLYVVCICDFLKQKSNLLIDNIISMLEYYVDLCLQMMSLKLDFDAEIPLKTLKGP